jgi:lauroyl/myristoyl acyltransferase
MGLAPRIRQGVKWLLITPLLTVADTPLRRPVLNTVALVDMLVSLARPRLVRAARSFLRAADPDHSFTLPAFFFHRARFRLWNQLCFAHPETTCASFSLTGLERVLDKGREGRGVILLGIHTIVSVYGIILRHLGVPLQILTTEPDVLEHGRMPTDGLDTPRRRFIGSHLSLLPAGRSERALLRHLLGGGCALIVNDYPSPNGRGMALPLLGQEVTYSLFPFRLALRHDIPLLYCVHRVTAGGGIEISCIEPPHFSDPGEGLRHYLAFLEGEIRSSPPFWGGALDLFR